MGENARMAIVGGGPSGLLIASALARRGIATTVFERDEHPEIAPRFNPDRSYTIDISGHGRRALLHTDVTRYFDERMIPFNGLKLPNGSTQKTDVPGWTGSRGDIVRSLMAPITERHGGLVTLHHETKITAADVEAGRLTYASSSGAPVTDTFDLIIGSDGTGSVVRDAMQRQVAGFAVTRASYPNYCTMIELDRVDDSAMDCTYIHGLSVRPFTVAGAIKGDQEGRPSRWFCAIGTKKEQTFESSEQAREYFRERVPRILDLASDDRVAAFAKRPCYHIGQTLACSQLHGGRAVLLGDAAAAFPPIGQGVNAAMESAMMLDLCIGETGASPRGLLEAAARYTARWKPEADAVAWMAVRSLFENRYHMMRASIAGKLRMSIFEDAKSSTIPYSEVKRRAARLWPLWA